MPTRVFLYKKDGDNRLWMDTDQELAPDNDVGLFKSRMPVAQGHVDRGGWTILPGADLQTWSSNFVPAFYDDSRVDYVISENRSLFKLLGVLTTIKGISAVSVSRYTIAIDKTRAVAWREIISQLMDIVESITGMSVYVEGLIEFLDAVGEDSSPHSEKCPTCGCSDEHSASSIPSFDPDPSLIS